MSGQPSREEQWIDWIRSQEFGDAAFSIGLGDDAVVWMPSAGLSMVATVDVQSEGTHFRLDQMDLRTIGRRAVSTSVSDLAAMAARPTTILVAILAPSDMSDAGFRELYGGIVDATRGYGMTIAGGNISRGALSITVTALGECPPGEAIGRSGLLIGESIWVTGSPGASRLGWLLAERGVSSAVDASIAVDAFRSPRARVEEALFLREHWRPSAMLDLSDGLAKDLGHLLSAGESVGVELDQRSIRELEFAPIALSLGYDPVELCLAGGEDYELCFSAPTPDPSVLEDFRRRFVVDVRRLGTVVHESGLWLLTDEGRIPVSTAGFEHF